MTLHHWYQGNCHSGVKTFFVDKILSVRQWLNIYSTCGCSASYDYFSLCSALMWSRYMPVRSEASFYWWILAVIPGENLSRIFKDLSRSSWGPLRILLRIFMRIFKILVKIFKDPSFSCQDLQGSLIFLPRSSRIFDFLAKIFEDLWLSCQDL